jgi:orotidine-5'-phosphate decarboxylase
MVKAAVNVLPNTKVTGVTILTSLSDADVAEIGFRSAALESAVDLAKVAVNAGAAAIVCSPLEISAVRQQIGTDPIIITPGVRPLDMVGTDDQQRTMTPKDAIAAGANLVVIGRPITQSWTQGAQAMKERAQEIGADLI